MRQPAVAERIYSSEIPQAEGHKKPIRKVEAAAKGGTVVSICLK
jgi:hypothetical protein